MRKALRQKRKFLKVIIHSKALAKLFNIHGGVTRVNVEMITPKGVLEIRNPQNKHILLANDLVDLLGIKRRCKSKRFKSITNHFLCCDLLDKNEKIFKGKSSSVLGCFGQPCDRVSIILRSQLNEKYHRGITSNLCEFSWPKGINGLPLRFELEIIYGCSLNNPTLLRETVVPLEDNTADVTPVTAFVWQTDLIFFYLPRPRR